MHIRSWLERQRVGDDTADAPRRYFPLLTPPASGRSGHGSAYPRILLVSVVAVAVAGVLISACNSGPAKPAKPSPTASLLAGAENKLIAALTANGLDASTAQCMAQRTAAAVDATSIDQLLDAKTAAQIPENAAQA